MSNVLLVDKRLKSFPKTETKAKTEKSDKTQNCLPRIHLAREPRFYVRIEDPSAGFRAIGQSKEIVEAIVDANYRILVRYRNKARRRRSRSNDDNLEDFGWTVLGKLLMPSNDIYNDVEERTV